MFLWLFCSPENLEFLVSRKLFLIYTGTPLGLLIYFFKEPSIKTRNNIVLLFFTLLASFGVNYFVYLNSFSEQNNS